MVEIVEPRDRPSARWLVDTWVTPPGEFPAPQLERRTVTAPHISRAIGLALAELVANGFTILACVAAERVHPPAKQED